MAPNAMSAMADAASKSSLHDATDRVEIGARKSLAAVLDGDMLRTQLVVLRRFLKREPADTVAMRKRVCAAVQARDRYLRLKAAERIVPRAAADLVSDCADNAQRLTQLPHKQSSADLSLIPYSCRTVLPITEDPNLISRTYHRKRADVPSKWKRVFRPPIRI